MENLDEIIISTCEDINIALIDRCYNRYVNNCANLHRTMELFRSMNYSFVLNEENAFISLVTIIDPDHQKVRTFTFGCNELEFKNRIRKVLTIRCRCDIMVITEYSI